MERGLIRRLCYGTSEFSFELYRKRGVALGSVTVDHWWMPITPLYGQRQPEAPPHFNHIEILRLYWFAITEHRAISDREAQEKFLLASIVPRVRAEGMLAQHIDSIRCFPDGKVIVRTCQLGALANPIEFCSALAPEGVDAVTYEPAEVGRRRSRRRINIDMGDDEEVQVANDFAVDLTRFAGLAPEWFTEDTFTIPEKKSWSEEHAMEVAAFRLESKATMRATAEHFGNDYPN